MKNINPYLCLFVLAISSCQHPKVDNKTNVKSIVLYFSNYNPQTYKTPGLGFFHLPIPKVLYTDSTETLKEFMPDTGIDTLTIYSPEKFKELALSYRDFEYAYYPLIQGDTITVSMDSLNYPILHSRHHPEHDRIYNMNYELRKGKTHCGLEAKTCLGSSFATIAQNKEIFMEDWGEDFYKDYCPIDSLQNMFEAYKKAYINTINGFKQQQIISDEMHEYYHYLLRIKEYESQRILNEDTAFYHQMEADILDKHADKPSYREYLNSYIGFYNRHIKTIHKAQSSYTDWLQTFDGLSRKPFQPKSKKILLERCIREIGDSFSAKDLNRYLDKYLEITQDTLLYNEIREQYNLAADTNQLILKDKNGRQTTFQKLLEDNKGKVLYVDFWASWCVPCREEMAPSAKLRKEYEGKDLVFVYLAFKDTESSWQKAIEQEGLSALSTNFFITNAKNSKMLEKIKLELIPRYLLFDKQGNIVEMNAPRPSDKKIKATIDKYLY